LRDLSRLPGDGTVRPGDPTGGTFIEELRDETPLSVDEIVHIGAVISTRRDPILIVSGGYVFVKREPQPVSSTANR
jgi:hypothetical protein